MRKDEITYHQLGYGYDSVPAVNVKVHFPRDPRSLFLSIAEEAGYDRSIAEQWYDAEVEDPYTDNRGEQALNEPWVFESATEQGWEQLQSIAEEVYGPGVKVYSEGRSGGWAYIDGIDNDTEGWDAVALAKWGKFARLARIEADDIPYRMADAVVYNTFAAEQEQLGAVLNA